MQLAEILNLYTKKEQKFLKKVKKQKMLPNITTENRDGVTQADETMSDRYNFLPTAHEFAEHIDQTLNGILDDELCEKKSHRNYQK